VLLAFPAAFLRGELFVIQCGEFSSDNCFIEKLRRPGAIWHGTFRRERGGILNQKEQLESRRENCWRKEEVCERRRSDKTYFPEEPTLPSQPETVTFPHKLPHRTFFKTFSCYSPLFFLHHFDYYRLPTLQMHFVSLSAILSSAKWNRALHNSFKAKCTIKTQ
jgi:hypothetical protein